MSDVAENPPQYEDLIVEPREKPLVWLIYLLLFAITIPWYWPAGYIGPLVLGLPLWVATTLGGVVLLALWTVFTIGRYWIHRVDDVKEDGS